MRSGPKVVRKDRGQASYKRDTRVRSLFPFGLFGLPISRSEVSIPSRSAITALPGLLMHEEDGVFGAEFQGGPDGAAIVGFGVLL